MCSRYRSKTSLLTKTLLQNKRFLLILHVTTNLCFVVKSQRARCVVPMVDYQAVWQLAIIGLVIK